MAVVKYEEIERHGSWGMANTRRKALAETYGAENLFIFKDLSKSPFTALRTDAYVLCLRKLHGLGGNK